MGRSGRSLGFRAPLARLARVELLVPLRVIVSMYDSPDIGTLDQNILDQHEHRPWPLPRGPWRMFMRWSDLAFLHWRVPTDALRPLVPAALEIDTFDGRAYVGVVPFRMEATRWRWAPPIPTATEFPETNVRTYVRSGDRAGVWFLSLDAASRLAVWGARFMLNLPYYYASMSLTRNGDSIHAISRRVGTVQGLGRFDATFEPVGEVRAVQPGTIDHWFTERYCLFGQRRGGAVYWMDVHHRPWPLQCGAATINHNTMAAAGGVELPDEEPIVHFAKSIDVLAWLPSPIRS